MSRSDEEGGLDQEIQQQVPFASVEEEAFLNLQRTANLLAQAHGRFLEPFGLTPTQYNALRILRGARPDRLACREVGDRMVTPVPDVTRLLDRLADKGLVERQRDGGDRRVVKVGISPAGLALVLRLDQPVANWLKETLGTLAVEPLRQLSRTLTELRAFAPHR